MKSKQKQLKLMNKSTQKYDTYIFASENLKFFNEIRVCIGDRSQASGAFCSETATADFKSKVAHSERDFQLVLERLL
jgi:hypothetical protein